MVYWLHNKNFEKYLNILFAQETNVAADGNDLFDLFKTQQPILYPSTIMKSILYELYLI